MTRPRLGVSSCLLGEAVRYDGRHKRDDFLVAGLGRHVEWVPVCPEVEVGMGVPREPVRLEAGPRGLRMVAFGSRTDHTEAMAAFAAGRLEALRPLGLCGYVLKADSPSCGPSGVPVSGSSETASGVFASALAAAYPDLPVTDESALSDPRRRESFVATIFALDLPPEAHHGLLLSRMPAGVPGTLVGSEDVADYRRRFVAAMREVPTREGHLHALEHLADEVRPFLKGAEHERLSDALTAYGEGEAALSRPVGVLRDLAARYHVASLLREAYLRPHPLDLRLYDAI